MYISPAYISSVRLCLCTYWTACFFFFCFSYLSLRFMQMAAVPKSDTHLSRFLIFGLILFVDDNFHTQHFVLPTISHTHRILCCFSSVEIANNEHALISTAYFDAILSPAVQSFYCFWEFQNRLCAFISTTQFCYRIIFGCIFFFLPSA